MQHCMHVLGLETSVRVFNPVNNSVRRGGTDSGALLSNKPSYQ
jgi:hypothetical protein